MTARSTTFGLRCGKLLRVVFFFLTFLTLGYFIARGNSFLLTEREHRYDPFMASQSDKTFGFKGAPAFPGRVAQ